MFDQLLALAANSAFLFGTTTAVAVFATILTIALPMMSRDKLGPRMKSVALERDKIKARERARMVADKNAAKGKTARAEPTALIKVLVNKLNLRNLLADENTTNNLMIAGLRGPSPMFVFLFARFALPFVFFGAGALYFFVISDVPDAERNTMTRIMYSLMVAYAGFYAPIMYLNSKVKSRQSEISRAWPDALDLTLICVESGMSIEASFRRVSSEIGTQSIPLAEELVLTTAELSYLSDRRQAYENLSIRTGLKAVKEVATTLIQAERYGTPLGQSLRVLSQENRDYRMSLAEKKAAALSPKLTVPMILFFLPVLFVVILSPGVMTAMRSSF